MFLPAPLTLHALGELGRTKPLQFTRRTAAQNDQISQLGAASTPVPLNPAQRARLPAFFQPSLALRYQLG
eukprot:4590460-Amphidinium_carterae.1